MPLETGVLLTDNHAVDVAAVDGRPEIGRRISFPAARWMTQASIKLDLQCLARGFLAARDGQGCLDHPRVSSIAQLPKYIAESLFENDGLGPTTP